MKKNNNYYQEQFVDRHIGSSQDEISQMLHAIGINSIEELINFSVPKSIQSKDKLNIGDGLSEKTLIEKLKSIAEKNVVMKSYIGMGYSIHTVPSRD